MYVGRGKCTQLPVQIAVKNARFPSNLLRADLYTVEIATRSIGDTDLSVKK
jgi:hypothetical protein